MIKMNRESGELEEIESTPKYQCGLFLYGKDKDLNKIVNHCPLVFNNIADLIRYLKTKSGLEDIKSWLTNDNSTIVIRKIDIFE